MKHIKKLFRKQDQHQLTQAEIEQTQLGCQISQAAMQMGLGF